MYLLSTLTAAPRLMHDGKLTGCFVSDDLLAKVYAESVDDHIERAAQQVAMYRSLGAAGVDVAGVPDFETFARILQRAAEIGTDWEQFKDNLYWPAKEGFYLYDEAGRPTPLCDPDKTFASGSSTSRTGPILDPRYRGFHAFKKTMAFFGADRPESGMYKAFNAFEKAFKYLAFECHECGDCFLPENFGLCTIGGCEKGMDNAPCGDATVDGRCGNNLDRVCIGERIYLAAAAEKDGRQRLRATDQQAPQSGPGAHLIHRELPVREGPYHEERLDLDRRVDPRLHPQGRGRDEATGGSRATRRYTQPSEALHYIQALIESQADDGADYIAVNVDAFGEDDPPRPCG